MVGQPHLPTLQKWKLSHEDEEAEVTVKQELQLHQADFRGKAFFGLRYYNIYVQLFKICVRAGEMAVSKTSAI